MQVPVTRRTQPPELLVAVRVDPAMAARNNMMPLQARDTLTPAACDSSGTDLLQKLRLHVREFRRLEDDGCHHLHDFRVGRICRALHATVHPHEIVCPAPLFKYAGSDLQHNTTCQRLAVRSHEPTHFLFNLSCGPCASRKAGGFNRVRADEVTDQVCPLRTHANEQVLPVCGQLQHTPERRHKP